MARDACPYSLRDYLDSLASMMRMHCGNWMKVVHCGNWTQVVNCGNWTQVVYYGNWK